MKNVTFYTNKRLTLWKTIPKRKVVILKKLFTIAVLAIVFFSFIPSAFAFSDVGNGDGKKEILALKERGIASGVGKDKFAPEKELTYAEALTFIARTFGWTLDDEGKNEKASSYFPNVGDDKWYAESFLLASKQGISLDKNVQPERAITKEEFVHFVFQAMTKKYELYFIELYKMFDDEQEVAPEFMTSVQKMIISDITPLENNRFYPKKNLNRKEGAIILYRTLEFLSKQKLIEL